MAPAATHGRDDGNALAASKPSEVLDDEEVVDEPALLDGFQFIRARAVASSSCSGGYRRWMPSMVISPAAGG